MFLPPPPGLAPDPPIVELFTSEGCSSCPLADALLSRYAAEGKVILLAQHVDYWDRLGWRDPFSSPEATRRQVAYRVKFRNEQVYTPQAVVNGSAEFVGNDESRLRAALARATPPRRFSVTFTPQGKEYAVETVSLPDVDVIVAVVRPPVETKVPRGENAGRTLAHSGVVRSLRLLGPSGTKYAVAAPAKGDRLVAFIQRRGYGAILGSAQVVP